MDYFSPIMKMLNTQGNCWKSLGGHVRSVYQRPLWRLFPFILIIGALFSALIPPFQSPDEQDHIKRAYLLSQGRIAMINLPGESTGGFIDTGLISYINQFQHLWHNSNERLTLDDRNRAAAITWTGLEEFGSSPGVNYYFPVIYTPQAAGLGIGKFLGMSVADSYFLARFFAFTFSVFILFSAFTIYRPSPILIGLLLTPLMVFQFCSASQDGVSSALVVLAGALFMRLMTTRESTNTRFYFLAFTILILVTSRVNLFPLIGLLFIVSFVSKTRMRYTVSALITVLSLGWILYALSTTIDNRVSLGGSVSEIVLYYALNPFDLIGVLIETFTTSRITTFYHETFFGLLGWLDTYIGDESIQLLTGCFVILLLLSVPARQIKEQILPRTSLIIISISSLFLVFFLLLVTWNPHPAAFIDGVQGRYFWAPVILFIYGISANWDDLGRIRQAITFLALLIITVITFITTPTVLIDRYYLNNQPTESRNPIKEQHMFTEVEAQITSAPNLIGVEKGGYIDKINHVDNAISITGWGLFTDEEKTFLSNLPDTLPVKYLTIVRHDVANSIGDPRFIYAGFILTIPLTRPDLVESLAEVCLYSQDSILGINQIQSNIPDIFGCKFAK
jgi:uncharacterized membrane protein